jgi:hypothetical protein
MARTKTTKTTETEQVNATAPVVESNVTLSAPVVEKKVKKTKAVKSESVNETQVVAPVVPAVENSDVVDGEAPLAEQSIEFLAKFPKS